MVPADGLLTCYIKTIFNVLRANVSIEANANEEGHLYGSVGAPEISRALKALNLKIEPDMVRLEGPIRECALYAVKLHLGYAKGLEVELVKKLVVVLRHG